MWGLLVFFVVSAAAAVILIALVIAHAMLHPPRRTAAYALRRGWAIDPGGAGFAFEEWKESSNGREIAVWEITRPAGGVGTGFAASGVCVHGWGESRIDSLAILREGIPFFDRVMMFDRAGHGESSGCARLGDAREVDDLAAIVEHLDGESVFLIASGSGAALAGAYTARTATRSVTGSVLINPIEDDVCAIRAESRARGWPVRPFFGLVVLWLRVRAIRPARHLKVRCPVLIVDVDANEKLPEREVARVREFVSVLTAQSGIEPD